MATRGLSPSNPRNMTSSRGNVAALMCSDRDSNNQRETSNDTLQNTKSCNAQAPTCLKLRLVKLMALATLRHRAPSFAVYGSCCCVSLTQPSARAPYSLYRRARCKQLLCSAGPESLMSAVFILLPAAGEGLEGTGLGWMVATEHRPLGLLTNHLVHRH